MDSTQQFAIVMAVVNLLLTVVATFGSIIIKGALASIKELRVENTNLSERLRQVDEKHSGRFDGFVRKEEFNDFRAEQRDQFREFREEQRENFSQLFAKIDSVRDDLSRKVDRGETR